MKNKKTLNRFFIIAEIIALIAVLIYTFFIEPDSKRIIFLLGYFLPIILLFLYWIKIKVENFQKVNLLFYLDLVVTIIAGIRAINPLMPFLPYSGHVLFILYSMISTRNRNYRILAGIMFAITTFFKIFIWHDYFSWLAGMILSMPFIAIAILFDNSKKVEINKFNKTF
jgi:hypothetical protein